MKTKNFQSTFSRALGMDPALVISLAIVVFFFVAAGIIAFLNTRAILRDADSVTHTHEVLTVLDDILSLVKDAETGQRGFVLTGDEKYLTPYNMAITEIEERLEDAERLVGDNARQLERIPALRKRIDAKLKELKETIEIRRTDGFDAVRERVVTDRGMLEMEAIREQIALMEAQERELRTGRLGEMNNAYQTAVASNIVTTVLGVFLTSVVGHLLRRAALSRRRQEWLLRGQNELSAAMLGDQRLSQLGGSALKFLADYLDAHAGAFFVEDGGRFRRVATYGVRDASQIPEGFQAGDGLLGQAVQDGKTFLVSDVPDGYLTFGSALGQGKPRHLVIAPAAGDGGVKAVLELGFVHPISEPATELIESASNSIAAAVQAAVYRAHLQDMLEETQRQSEEIQAQSEELRVANEELEEQGRFLRESQSRLEQQQAELEQTNVQLTEQAEILASERDLLSRTKSDLQVKAEELEQASQYKSDFLANMSHELRTPLNSSLILAKLLADNPSGNLSAEQVRYAETIRSAGNDLLALINDILDLSKIEAGRMEVRSEPVLLSKLAEDLTRTFDPVASQKGITFSTNVSSECPKSIETDRQRLEQVLKNLLSNAIKFTDTGSVELMLRREPAGRIAFAVKDTGIGIPRHQQQMVFEAFRQADGTTNRKYGGTGLGLSISRELARLLGGEIHLTSEPGVGSTFTVILPEIYDATLVSQRSQDRATREPGEVSDEGIRSMNAGPTVARETLPTPTVPARLRYVADDRDHLVSGSRRILMVEDDEAFARILYDLGRELGFQCLIASTAEDALAMAVQYSPNAVVLDIGLPDHSGLSVLDRLKQDGRTRHIPVHVVSAGDYAQTALSLGAVGYMLKPVKREELAEALKQLESRLEQRMRRVLIVEDDPVQLDSMQRLLGSDEVETVGAANAAACLNELKDATFDCMVLDLTLPDASGYSLLETLSREDAYSFPPVIVYTGRDLSADEEQRLRRYSKSIIIKGAKSPERLLDEVTLFLHQVVAEMPAERQKMLAKARSRDAVLEGRSILIVEDDVRNVFALTSILEPRGATVRIARNGREALEMLEKAATDPDQSVDLVLMDVMMPEMDGLTALREIRKRREWAKLPVLMLTAKAMRDDQETCLAAGANDYMAKPLDVDKLLSLVRVWMPR
jgi:signal transduction histidine kinase/CheY-like chemotaxis protein/CHASE3 domain sensor protein